MLGQTVSSERERKVRTYRRGVRRGPCVRESDHLVNTWVQGSDSLSGFPVGTVRVGVLSAR